MPGALDGHGITPQTLSVDRKALRAALAQEAGLNALIGLDVGGTRHLAMARQLQRDPLKRQRLPRRLRDRPTGRGGQRGGARAPRG